MTTNLPRQTNPAFAKDALYAINREGFAEEYAANSGKVRHTFKELGKAHDMMIVDNTLFVGAESAVHAIEIGSRKPLWKNENCPVYMDRGYDRASRAQGSTA